MFRKVSGYKKTGRPWLFKTEVWLAIVFIAANLLVLDFFFLRPKEKTVTQIPQNLANIPTTIPSVPLSPTQLSTVSQTAQTQTVVSNSGVKDYFIPLGSGTTSSNDWTSIEGAQAFVDPAQYGTIKTVKFEASISNPNSPQNVSVRLFNTTANHVVWNSEMTMTSDKNAALLISNPVTLDSGNNLYQVQVKTQLMAPTVLTQSRVHITTF
ncbi:MAG TPA: hypothetical protein VLF68_02105 [Candidatus Saccharimonadales bacterium]|nr:hypothetical protein [Candidatus Saccharimonadales bacterium]